MATLPDYLRMIRFSHTIFAMPFALLATFLAADGGQGGFCGWGRLGLIVLCMVFARSAAMTFNRITDTRIDAGNPRTAGREIPRGVISLRQAWGFWIICVAGFLASTAGFRLVYENPWPLYFAVPVLTFICLYSYTKRFTWACHFWLGAALMLSPVCAWVAVSPPAGPLISLQGIYLGMAVLLWTTGFDIIYACQDVDVDRRDGLFSAPARLGVEASLWLSRVCHSVCITFLLMLGREAKLGWYYFTAVLLVVVLLVIEHWLVRGGRMQHVGLAFATINGIISILLAAAGIADVSLVQ